MVRLFALVLAIFFLASAGFCGTRATLRGVLTAYGKPFPFANVIVTGTRIGALTDSLGRFTLREVPTGPHQIVFLAPGWEREVIALRVRVGHNPAVFASLKRRHVVSRFGSDGPPRCDPYFMVEPYQGDRAVPPGAVVLDYVGEVDRARVSDSMTTLLIESVDDPCVLEISFRTSGRSACVVVLAAGGDTVRVFDGGDGVPFRWDGTDSHGKQCGAGRFRIVLAHSDGVHELHCQRVKREGEGDG